MTRELRGSRHGARFGGTTQATNPRTSFRGDERGRIAPAVPVVTDPLTLLSPRSPLLRERAFARLSGARTAAEIESPPTP